MTPDELARWLSAPNRAVKDVRHEVVAALRRLGKLERVLAPLPLVVAETEDGDFFAERGTTDGSQPVATTGETPLAALLALHDALEAGDDR